jgi:hypothetical protein
MKHSKISFGVYEMEYLDSYYISRGIKVDLKNISAMMEWLIAKTLKNIMGLLGLKG